MDQVSIPTSRSEPSASAELKPCPFCGEQPKRTVNSYGTVFATCYDCLCTPNTAEHWNRRADSAEVESIDAALERVRAGDSIINRAFTERDALRAEVLYLKEELLKIKFTVR